MSFFLGIDTSNYTTSAAVYDIGSGGMLNRKTPLPVRPGEKGIRQNDAVFLHTLALPELTADSFRQYPSGMAAIGVSSRPRDVEGSYMPCFLAGVNSASCIASALAVPLYSFSHQAGHIAAALYSAGKLSLVNEKFIAFHVSGGTTEALLVEPERDTVFTVKIIGKTNDLNAGQAVDRVGAMLGLPFPAGTALEELALRSAAAGKAKPAVENGNASFSGLENLCAKMMKKGAAKEDVAGFCLEYISAALEKMVLAALKSYGPLPLVFSGGVMSNRIIRKRITGNFEGALFAEPDYSKDNAAGVAVLAGIRHTRYDRGT